MPGGPGHVLLDDRVGRVSEARDRVVVGGDRVVGPLELAQAVAARDQRIRDVLCKPRCAGPLAEEIVVRLDGLCEPARPRELICTVEQRAGSLRSGLIGGLAHRFRYRANRRRPVESRHANEGCREGKNARAALRTRLLGCRRRRPRRPLPGRRALGSRDPRPRSRRSAGGLARARAAREADPRRRRARVRALGRERRSRLPGPGRGRRSAAREPAGERQGGRHGPNVPHRHARLLDAPPRRGRARGGAHRDLAAPARASRRRPQAGRNEPALDRGPLEPTDARWWSTRRWGTSPGEMSSPGARARTTSHRSAATRPTRRSRSPSGSSSWSTR